MQLRSEKFELAEQLKETQTLLRVQSEGWKKEQNKTLNLMFSELLVSNREVLGWLTHIVPTINSCSVVPPE